MADYQNMSSETDARFSGANSIFDFRSDTAPGQVKQCAQQWLLPKLAMMFMAMIQASMH